ncbi:cAMP and cAMP-inhibited cGMP 3',5'-cyclic phosphodiesterase 10A-like [Gigantopelta aegis]|uniref:cAMP and cAMP-inhibited cGMP 3',5'-cyclic phosphodiesterase 10A-like n=1 Tax=Gigantopelta aegis TaxID=1735272 RepID=UPI001B887CAA|nr:cAMP and cAMP-inhibited cGMP 3',5'-cyclic phosphodiesterase 10A-like [Gigantopelta aegis]
MVEPQTLDSERSALINYFKKNPNFLDEIIHSLSKKKIQFLLQMQRNRYQELNLNADDSTPSRLSESYVSKTHTFQSSVKTRQVSVRKTSETLLTGIKVADIKPILFEATTILASALRVDWFSLYVPGHQNKDLLEYSEDGSIKQHSLIGKGTTVSAETAFLCETLMVENLPKDARFPKGVGHPDRDVRIVLSIPLLFPSGDLIGVIELCKGGSGESFNEDDLQFASLLLGWMISTLHQITINRILDLQSELNDFLLETTRDLETEVSIDSLVKKILLFSKDLVHADRSAVFLINEENHQLYVDCFFDGLSKEGEQEFTVKKKLPFSCEQGIAGYVYKTAETVNIADAYNDKRFNSQFDETTGYHTKNILCMPIVTKCGVVGVIEMINSLVNDHFTLADERAFKTYAVYCALALHITKIYNELNASRIQYKVTMDLIELYIVASQDEIQTLSPNTPPEIIPHSFFHFTFDPYHHEKDLPQFFIYMIQDLFGKDTFDFTKLSRFIMTVRKNYRSVPYHNWLHGFQVAQAVYCMIKKNPGIFNANETMALIIASVCHDLDHRGYNNVFYEQTKSHMADLYGTSVMEQHHYKHTVTILQLKSHDIFSFLYTDEYNDMLLMIREAIIATDLSLVFGVNKELTKLMKKKPFNIGDEHNKKLVKALMMPVADVCSVAKTWLGVQASLKRLYKEFYAQGDLEKTHGFSPNERMDRDMKDDIPKQQFDFITFVCMPIYVTVTRVLPGCKPLLKQLQSNLKKWTKILAEKAREERRNKNRKRE